MFRRTAKALGATLAGAALTLGASPGIATAAPAAATAASVPMPFHIVAYLPTYESCQDKGRTGEPLWGRVWWCSPHGNTWVLWAR
ncbi:hypothetical protein [Streptomyces sp. NPDC048057]|uniref:hypothetical protein n=1 Tax=Streptomyces sp. NPDC048057 TaxID=3155628 RepID=UPI0033CB0951